MEDLKNSSYPSYKIMWAFEGDNIIWNMMSETHDDNCRKIQIALNKYINTYLWSVSFEKSYINWLENDVNDIYDINNEIHKKMRNAIAEFRKNESYNVYYWFDVDRTRREDFQWEHSPISGESLTKLSADFHTNNRLISRADFLVFPQSL